jgi:peptide/nickel transport system substrate-binding protein/oligopeptide transport system substrate-binding protein
METYLGPLYSADGSSNYSGWSNGDFDRLLVTGAKAKNQAAAIVKYQQAEQILATEMPVVPLWFGQHVYGHSRHVSNVRLDRFGRLDLLSIAPA